MKEYRGCAIYTRKSTEDGLEQEFNSLDAQREACEAFVLSQKSQGWKAIVDRYDDGGFSGGNTERPALKQLMADIKARRVHIVVVYKVDRLTRSLADFAKLVELFDEHVVSFVSVTQQFNTTSSMGRLTLNVLLSFAQFEREVTGERIRDKIAASKKKGMWMGGIPPIGYTPHERTLVIDEAQADCIRKIFRLYLEYGCVRRLKNELDKRACLTPIRRTSQKKEMGGKPFSRGPLYRILRNPVYIGKIAHKKKVYDGNQPAIVDTKTWDAVQAHLNSNRHNHQTRATASHPSLLTGLVFDDHGNRLTPTHTKKGERRYRYYVTHSLIKKAPDSSPTRLRLPARELENAVLGTVESFLTDKSKLLEFTGTANTHIQKKLHQAQNLAKALAKENSPGTIEILNRIVKRITIHNRKIVIVFHTNRIWASNDISDVTASITLPVRLKRCGMAMRLIVQPTGTPVPKKTDPKMVALIAKSHQWFAKLTSGQYDSIQSLARQENVSRSYFTRTVYLALLDPFIVQKILQGEQPIELNSECLKKAVPLPLDWSEQRRLLGVL